MSAKPDISVLDWIKYNPNVGTLGLFHFGLPGSGKSNFQSGLFQMCLRRGEFLIMPGDRFCEWRHFPNHKHFPTKMQILVPKFSDGQDIHYHNFKKNNWFIDVDFEDLDIFQFLDEEKRMLVVYDQHLSMANRVYLWVNIFQQLLDRTEYLDTAFGLFFHEAGIYFDEFAEGEHWKAIRLFSSLFVEHRKALVRPVFLSQLESEVKSTIRKKCPFHIIRKSFLSKSYAKSLRKAAPFTAIHQYHFVYGGIYIKSNVTNKFWENKEIYKMIPPRVSFNEMGAQIDEEEGQKSAFPLLKCKKCSHEWQANVSKPKKCPNCGKRYDYHRHSPAIV